MNSLLYIKTLISKIQYKDWTFNVMHNHDSSDLYMQITFEDKCNINEGEMYINKCRKWRLSRYMTDSEIVGTCYAAVKMAEEHELAEKFKFKGALPFKHHANIHDLCDIDRYKTPDKRD